MRFELFRVQLHPPKQGELFGKKKAPEILREAIDGKPSAEIRKGFHWHIGNLEPIDESAVYFRIGRTTKTTVGLYDAEAGEFVEQDSEESPWTHALMDFGLQVCAIAAKPRLGKVGAIARQLERLLEQSPAVKASHGDIEVAAINDPERFIEELRSAHQIMRFVVDFSRPNPWDVEETFQRPLQEFTRRAGGDKITAEVNGDSLDPETLADTARAAAATGNNARAWLRFVKAGEAVWRRLRGNPSSVTVPGIESPEERKQLRDDLRELYNRLRQPER